MTLRTVLLFLFVCVNVFYANSQKVNVGVHLGMTTTKMLWADKMDDEPWSAIQYPETQFRTSYSAGFSVDYLYNSRFYSPFQLDFYNKRFSISTGGCLLYTSDAADERSSVDLGGRRIIKKKKKFSV